MDMCGDNRFEIIEAAKSDLINCTNIKTSPDEMEVLDSFLFRCWQMGWLDKYTPRDDGVYMELFAVKNRMRRYEEEFLEVIYPRVEYR